MSSQTGRWNDINSLRRQAERRVVGGKLVTKRTMMFVVDPAVRVYCNGARGTLRAEDMFVSKVKFGVHLFDARAPRSSSTSSSPQVDD